MAVFVQSLSAAEVLAAITSDTTKYAGANIANIDYALSTLRQQLKTTWYLNETATWVQASDGTISMVVDAAPRNPAATWYLRYAFTTNGGGSDGIEFRPLWEDANNFIDMLCRDSGSNSPMVRKNVATSYTTLITAGSAISDTAEHYTEFVRNIRGNLELLHDGGSIGTATDTFDPTLNHAEIAWADSAGGSTISTREIKVVDPLL